VVLLDEFEKADPNLFDILLQLLGEGRLTDSQGRLADFRNAVVIMTSNLGAESFRAGSVGFGEGEFVNWREHFQREVRKFVRPEFLGRIDRIVPFRPLSKEIVKQIAHRELNLLSRRSGLKYSDASLEFSDAAVDLLCELGYQPRYGARPLRRAIEQNITVPLADALSQISSDSTWTFEIGASDGRITVSPKKKSTKTKTHKEIEGEVINAWQQLGAMARTARTCGPMRDLENELERTLRQNELIEQRLKLAQGPRRIAVLRDQLQQGQVEVEVARRVRENLWQVVEQICRSQLELMVAWHRNQPLDWSAWQQSGKSHLTQLRKVTEDVLKRRTSSNDWMSLLAVGKGEAQLELLWKAYRILAQQNQWTCDTYLLQEYDPRRDESTPEYRKRVSERKIDVTKTSHEQPELRLVSPLESPDNSPEKLADAFRHDGSKSFNSQRAHVCGFAMQIRGAGVESWLGDEHGILHFFDAAATGAKRRMRFKLSVFKGRLAQIFLPHDWLEATATAERDPRRVIDVGAQHIYSGMELSMPYAQGKLSEGLVALISQEHEQALWTAIGYTGIPREAHLHNAEFEIPF
jgi:hypothetical protein